MSLLIVRDSLASKLAAADAPIELCTADGRVLGYFTPSKPKQYNLDPGISEEELARRFAQAGGRPLNDILRDMGARS